MATLGTLVAKITGDTSGLRRAAQRTRTELHGMEQSFGSLKRVALSAFTVLGGGFAFAKFFRDVKQYEAALVDMGKVTEQSFSKINKQIASLPTALGNSTELIKGYYQTISAGVTEPVKALELLTTASKLAKVAHIDQATSVKTLAVMMGSYRDQLKNTTDAANLLLSIERYGITTAGEMAGQIGLVANLAHESGLSINEMGAALAQLTKAGIGTAESVTQLRSLLTNLGRHFDKLPDSVRKFGSAAAAIQQLGFEGTLKAIVEGVHGNDQALTKLLGRQEAHLAMLQLLKNSGKEYEGVLAGMKDRVGALDKAWKNWKGTLEGIWSTLKNKLENTLIKFGNEILPQIKEGLEGASKWADHLLPILESVWNRGLRPLYEGWKALPGWMKEIGLIGAFLVGRTGFAVLASTSWFAGMLEMEQKLAKLRSSHLMTFKQQIEASKALWFHGVDAMEEKLKEFGLSIDNIGSKWEGSVGVGSVKWKNELKPIAESMEAAVAGIGDIASYGNDIKKNWAAVEKAVAPVQKHVKAIGAAQEQIVKSTGKVKEKALDLRGIEANRIKYLRESAIAVYDQVEATVKLKEQIAEQTGNLAEAKRLQNEIYDIELAKKLASREYTDDQEKALITLNKLAKAHEDIKKAVDKTGEMWKSFLNDLQSRVADTFKDMFQHGLDSFSNFLDSVKDLFENTLADIAAYWAEHKIILPIIASLDLGSLSVAAAKELGLSGGAGAGGTNAMSIMGTASSIFSGITGTAGKFFSFPGNTLAKLTYELPGIHTSLASIANWLNANPLGQGLSAGLMTTGLNLLMGQDLGKSLLSGALSGIGYAVGGPIGGIIGGLLSSVFGGLFGGGPPDLDLLLGFLAKGVTGKQASGHGGFDEQMQKGPVWAAQWDIPSEASHKILESLTTYYNKFFDVLHDTLKMDVQKAIDEVGSKSWHWDDVGDVLKKDNWLEIVTDKYTQIFFDTYGNTLLKQIGVGIDVMNMTTIEGLKKEGEKLVDTFTRVAGVMEAIPESTEKMRKFMEDAGDTAVQAYNDMVAKWDIITGIVTQTLSNALQNMAASDWETFIDTAMTSFKDQLRTGLAQAFGKDIVASLADALYDAFNVKDIMGLWEKVRSGETPISDVQNLIDKFNSSLKDQKPLWDEFMDILKQLGLNIEDVTPKITVANTALEKTLASTQEYYQEKVLGKTHADYTTMFAAMGVKLGQLGPVGGSLEDNILSLNELNTSMTYLDSLLKEGTMTTQQYSSVTKLLIDIYAEGIDKQKAAIQDAADAAGTLADSWKQVSTSASEALWNLQYSSSNPASSYNQLMGMRTQLRTMSGYTTPEGAQHYMTALEDYLQLAQKVYQRPSAEYQNIYKFTIDEFTKAQNKADDEAERQRKIQEQQLTFLEHIADNTDDLLASPMVTINAQGMPENEVRERVINLLESDVGRIIIQNVAAGQ